MALQKSLPLLLSPLLGGVGLTHAYAAVDSVHLPLASDAFSEYPGYTGNLAVSGTVQVGQEGADTQVLFFALEGVDAKCNETANVSGVPNACGIHVHAGLSCADAGGHFYDTASLQEDPWASIRYTVAQDDAETTTSGQNVRVATGKTLADVKGRTMVVHDVTGARVACSLLTAESSRNAALVVESFTPYPGYTGDLATAGTVGLEQIGTGTNASQALAFSLTGADPSCGTDDVSGVANACGIHVHEGSDCSNASTIGGHYYDLEAYPSEDPWKPIVYSAPGGNTTGVTTRIVTGVTNADVVNRTLIVHDVTGARIACGQIVNAPSVTTSALTDGSFKSKSMVLGLLAAALMQML